MIPYYNSVNGGPPEPVTALSPVAWYRFNTGMTVDAWVDQVAAQNFVQATATNQLAVTSHGSLLADGVDNFMTSTFNLAQPFTVYGLVNPVTWSANDRLISGSAANIQQVTGTPKIQFNCGTALGTISPVLNTVNVISVVGNGASSVIQLNKDTPVTGNAGVGSMNNPSLAASGVPSQFANTDNFEWIFFDSAHDEATRIIVITYLATVGGLNL